MLTSMLNNLKDMGNRIVERAKSVNRESFTCVLQEMDILIVVGSIISATVEVTEPK